MDIAIDHVLLGVPDLEAGMDRVERLLGTRPAPGGRHPDFGTHNALLSLSPACYLEVIAPDPELPTPDRGIGFGLDGLEEPRLVSWALRHPEVDAVAGRAGLGRVETGSRERGDGRTLRWRLTDPYAERMGGVIPFLIDWGETAHPAASAPPGGRLVDLRVEHPSPDEVRRVLAMLDCDDVTVRRGDAPRLVALIRTADATVELS
ncbi:MAG: VOC family protein [Gemmatimonadota bacterium]